MHSRRCRCCSCSATPASSARRRNSFGRSHRGLDKVTRRSKVYTKAGDADLFSDGIVGLSPLASRAARDALVNAGHVDAKSSRVLGILREASGVNLCSGRFLDSDAMPSATELAGYDGRIFARLDLAYAYHASSCEFIDATISFFSTHSPAIKISRGGASIIRESRRGKASKGGRESLVS